MKLSENIRKRLMKHNISLAVFSLFIAIVIWLIISMTQYKSIPMTIDHVTLSLDLSGSIAGDNGLEVTECDVSEVSVSLIGSRTQVGNIKNEELIAYLDTDNITSTGKRKVDIKIKNSRGMNITIKSITPSSASVMFDKMESRQFDVIPYAPNLSPAEGKKVDQEGFVCTPDKIMITGPAQRLDSISTVNAVYAKELNGLDDSQVLKSDYVELINSSGAKVDQEGLEFSTSYFNITVPIITEKEVSFQAALSGAPENFDQDFIQQRLTFSPESILLSSSNAKADIQDKLDIPIALSDIDSGYQKSFMISKILEDSGLTNKSQNDNVTVSFNSDGLAKTTLSIDPDSINVSNPPDNEYDYKVMQSQRIDVTLIGPADVINSITADKISAVANLIKNPPSSDYFDYTISVSVAGHDNVWAVSGTKITMQRIEKSDSGNDDKVITGGSSN